jgi:hypothetical protein
MFSSTLSLTSALDGGGDLAPRPGRFATRREPVAIVLEAGSAPGPVSMSKGNLAYIRIRFPDHPTRSELALIDVALTQLPV